MSTLERLCVRIREVTCPKTHHIWFVLCMLRTTNAILCLYSCCFSIYISQTTNNIGPSTLHGEEARPQHGTYSNRVGC